MKPVPDIGRAPFEDREVQELQDHILEWLARSFDNTRAHAALYISTSAAKTLVEDADPVKMGETTTAGLLDGFSHASDGRLIYARDETESFRAIACGSVASNEAASETSLYLAKNGTKATASRVDIYHDTADKPYPFSASWTFALGQGDYIDVMGGSDTNSEATLTRMNLTVQEAS